MNPTRRTALALLLCLPCFVPLPPAAAQEKSTLVQVTEARASATQVKVDASTITNPAAFQQYQQAQDKLSGVLGRLMMIQERYPDLKSNQNFMALQSQLEGLLVAVWDSERWARTEDRIDAAVRYGTTLDLGRQSKAA